MFWENSAEVLSFIASLRQMFWKNSGEVLSFFAPFVALFIFYYLNKYKNIIEISSESDEIKKIAEDSDKKLITFLKSEASTSLRFIGVVFFIMLISFYYYKGAKFATFISLSFLYGIALSILVIYFITILASKVNRKNITFQKEKGLLQSVTLAFSGSNIIGLVASAIALFGLGLFFLIGLVLVKNPQEGTPQMQHFVRSFAFLISGLGLGVSLFSLFSKLGGHLFIKASELFNDYIKEDETTFFSLFKKNSEIGRITLPLFESLIISVISTVIIGAFIPKEPISYMVFPLIIVMLGFISSILGNYFYEKKPDKDIQAILDTRLYTIFIFIVLSFLASFFVFGIQFKSLNIFLITCLGIACGNLISKTIKYYNLEEFSSYQKILNNLENTKLGKIINIAPIVLESVSLPVIVIIGTSGFSYWILNYDRIGLYGLGIIGVSILSSLGLIISMDSYRLLHNNNAEADSKIKQEIEELYNKTCNLHKGFDLGATSLSALAALAAYSQLSQIGFFNLKDGFVILGFLLGGIIPFFFASRAINSLFFISSKAVEQIKNNEENSIIRIVGNVSFNEMIFIGLNGIIPPIVVGALFGKTALAGFITGVILLGIIISFLLVNFREILYNLNMKDKIVDSIIDISISSIFTLIKLLPMVSIVIGILLQ